MKARSVALLLALACLAYLALIGYQAIVLIGTTDPLPMTLGIGLLLLPVVGVWVVVREVQFGARTQELAHILESEGGLPQDDLPRRPSGRPDVGAADIRFQERERDVENDPHNWRHWFLLAVAYDDAGDRRRGRAAMRHALSLHAATKG